jgi:hypothetical protein
MSGWDEDKGILAECFIELTEGLLQDRTENTITDIFSFIIIAELIPPVIVCVLIP